MHSNIYKISLWNPNVNYYWVEISDSNITNDILYNGAVMAYMGDTTLWNALPYANLNDEWRYYCQLNTVRMVYLHADGTAATYPGLRTFKVVTIAGQ